ncbi:hypothetical protein GCM10022206_88650 [Streptomyces chiangmaiensis]
MRTAGQGRRWSAIEAASSRDSRAAGIVASLGAGMAALTDRFDAHTFTVKGSRRRRGRASATALRDHTAVIRTAGPGGRK